MKKIKVLHFPIRNTNGGITRTAMKYWKFIDKTQFQFGFAACGKAKLDFEDDILKSGAEVHYISCYAEENSEQFALELRKILLDNQYDVIHLNTNWWKSCIAEKVAKEAGVKVILVHARSSGVDIQNDEKRAMVYERHQHIKNSFRKDMATDYVACSKTAAEFLFGDQIPQEEIVILHNALDTNRFNYSKEKRFIMRKQLNIENCYVIGNVGRMVYVKNHLFLLDCLYKVQKEVPNTVLLLLGDGDMRADIEKKAEKLGITDKVIFAGSVDDVENYLQAMDVFAFPSLFEGLGNVVIEAQAVGLKCIASENVPIETHITDNIEYFPLQEDLWVEKLIQLSDQYERKDMTQIIKDAGYDIHSEIKVLERIYLKALSIQ